MKKPRRDNEQPPLRIQFEGGYNAFTNTKQWTKKVNDETVIVTACPFKPGSMQAKEWHRGYTVAYFENLEKVNATRG